MFHQLQITESEFFKLNQTSSYVVGLNRRPISKKCRGKPNLKPYLYEMQQKKLQSCKGLEFRATTTQQMIFFPDKNKISTSSTGMLAIHLLGAIKIPSDTEVAPRYKLSSLLTLEHLRCE